MKQYCLKGFMALAALFCAFIAMAQVVPAPAIPNITRVEWYIDNDPGFGSATPIAITPAQDIANLIIPINPTSLTNGVHQLFVRARDANGKWSLTNKWLFYKPYNSTGGVEPAPAIPNIVALEYYIDVDPGYGAANPVAITPSTDLSGIVISANLNGLAAGAHKLHIRARDANGNWSLVNTKNFTVTSPVSASTIFVTSLSKTALCAAEPISMSYQATGTYNAGNVFTAYLSDAAGNFANEVAVGSLTGTALSGTIALNIPTSTPSGTGYKLRVKSSNPAITGGSSQAVLSITAAAVPSVAITAPNNGITCVPGNIQFSATPTNGGTTPTYEWFVNNVSAGTGPTFSSTTLAQGDVVKAKMTSSLTCTSTPTVTSNTITVNLTTVTPTISISMSPTGTTCANSTVNFNSTVTGGGSSPSITWKINGTYYTSGSSFSSNTLANGDVVTATLNSSDACASPTTVNSNSLTLTRTATTTYYADADGDGFGSAANTIEACSLPAGYVANSSDCNDANAAINPNTVWYKDADNDGYSDGTTITQCARPTGYKLATELTATSGDCDDNNSSLHGTYAFYADTDGDGYGSGASVQVCAANATTAPAGYSTNNTDCAPTDATKWRTANLYVDVDNDGYDAGQQSVCYGATLPAGYKTTTLGSDCDDSNAAIHQTFGFYEDTDGDGYGSGASVQVCAANATTAPAGFSTNNTDCAPTDVTKWRTANLYVDVDNDGYDAGQQSVCYGAAIPAGYKTTTLGSDCDDNSASIHPGATEICGNGIDENCNGMADDVCSNPDADGDGVPDATDCAPNDATKWQTANVYTDADGDGFTVGAIHSVCYGATLPAGVSLTSSGTDCDDSNSAVGSSIAAPTVNASTATAICAGSSATLTATPATGIQWQLNNSSISGATVATYAATQAGSYTAIRTVGTCTSPASNAITVTVNSAASNVALANSSDNNVNLVEACTENGWTYYVNPAQPSRFLIGIEWGSNTAARLNAVPQIGLLAGYTAAEQTSAPAKATYAMNRYWNVNNAGPLTAPINLRFFYAASEKTAVENAAANFAAANSAVEGTPAWFKTVGVPYTTSMVTPEGILNAILLMDMNTTGQTINGVLYAQFNGISSLSGGTYATTVGNLTVLPILLSSFTGDKISENANRLNWSVVCTDNRSNKIELQRSHNSASFTTIHAVQTTVENCNSAFAYTDNSPLKGSNYYRLKLTDADGKISYSHVILINNDAEIRTVKLSPNPAYHATLLTITTATAENAMIHIVDATGKTVMKKQAALSAGNNQVKIEVSNLANGLYLVKTLFSDGSVQTVKLSKQ